MLTHKGTQTLETPRLILRRAALSDADAMYRNWASNPEVTKFLTWPAYSSQDTAAKRLQIWQDGYASPETYQWMIVPKDLGETIGTISVVELDNRIEKAEIGYCIGSPWWHRGYTSEALRAVLDYLFAEVGFRRIAARHDTNNPHSGTVMQKCGMHYEGTLRQAGWNNQGVCDESYYSLLREEWRAMEEQNAHTL